MTTAMILDRRALRPLPCALLFSFFLFRSSFFLPLFPIPYSPLPAPGWIGGVMKPLPGEFRFPPVPLAQGVPPPRTTRNSGSVGGRSRVALLSACRPGVTLFKQPLTEIAFYDRDSAV